MRSFLLVASVVCWMAGVSSAIAQDQPAEKPANGERQAELEKALSEKLTGAALVGHFSVDGKENNAPGRPERYEIESATKAAGNLWLLKARIKYGKNDVTVPMMLPIVWAGDTPMISLTDLTIPGLGTFTSRVMFHGDRYAGTWQHGKVGGHMWGKIERIAAEESKAETKEKE